MAKFKLEHYKNIQNSKLKICSLTFVDVLALFHVVTECKGKMTIVDIVDANRASLGFQKELDGNRCNNMYTLSDVPTFPLLP